MRRLAIGAGAVGLAVLTVWGGGRPSVHWVGDLAAGGDGGSFGLTQADVAPGEVIADGDINLCVDGATPATVDSVRFRNGENLVVRQFAVRQLNYAKQVGLGTQRGSMVSAGFVPGRAEVLSPCGQDDSSPHEVSELGLDLTRSGTGTAWGRTLVVSYHAGGHHGRAEVPVTMGLCPGTCPPLD